MRRLGSVLIRFAGALLSVGLVAGLLVLPGWGPLPTAATEPLAVAVPAAPTDLVCPGTARLPTEPEAGDDVAYDPQFDPAPVDAVTGLVALSVDRPQATAVEAQVRSLADGTAVADVVPAAGGGATAVSPVDAGTVVHADASDGGPAWLAGSVAVTTTAGDLRGLVAASCRPASTEAWLVGGATTLGSSARLVLANPGRTAAQVTIELWGAAGPIDLTGAAEYLVPPGAERAVLLEGTAAEQPRLVVHVTASGGAVAAYLQDSELRGLTPAGVDDVVPGSAPALEQVVPGVAVAGTDADGADPGMLRLLAPAESGTAHVRVLGPDGEVDLPGATDLELDAGAVLDVPLDGLAEGTWTIVVDADVPVVAGAMITRGSGVGAAEVNTGLPLDRAWAAAVDPAASPLALPSGASWELSLANPGDQAQPAEITVLDDSGSAVATSVVDVAAGSALALVPADLDVPDGASVAGVVLRGEGVSWAAVLEVPDPAGPLVGVLSPVAPREPRDAVEVRLD
ncbi:DUF5719 family protein [Actinotalea sp. M2MS4P-6]|uniref:DUF5719 family protein n=1 Tax=Actinotalea sp. M2MS4P-6 TaxID=2983762 RepID=UPI0021E39EFB|nr:DUF5719 family protein [Actinotalea sp. M2MS4P-6]MCV2394161.1 DUF5719 family protein [Actinotalea sp. M2MS4P-6]